MNDATRLSLILEQIRSHGLPPPPGLLLGARVGIPVVAPEELFPRAAELPEAPTLAPAARKGTRRVRPARPSWCQLEFPWDALVPAAVVARVPWSQLEFFWGVSAG